MGREINRGKIMLFLLYLPGETAGFIALISEGIVKNNHYKFVVLFFIHIYNSIWWGLFR